MTVLPLPSGYDVSKRVDAGRSDCHITVGFDRERGYIPRFLVQLPYQVGTDPVRWTEIARMDHNETDPLGHDVYQEGLHVDVARRSADTVASAVAGRAVTGVKQTKQSATARNDLRHSCRPRRMVRLAMSDNPRRDTAPSGLGRCTDCGAVYPVCRSDAGWRAVGTDGTCRCGGDQFTLMEPEEPAARGTSRVSPRA